MQKSIVLGVTGGIGSGKSLICTIFSLMDIPIYYADEQAKYVMGNDHDLIAQLKKAFGNEAYDQQHKLNRTYLAKQVFSDADKLTQLNALVHPAVKKSFDNWCATHSHYPIVAKEAALLLESGSYKSVDKLIVVCSPLKLKLQRILQRDSHRTEKDVLAIMDKQWSDDKKIEKADYIIQNDERELILTQINTVIADIKKAVIG